MAMNCSNEGTRSSYNCITNVMFVANRTLSLVSILLIKLFALQMNLLLKEYLSSGDISEATRCLKELDVPHFHHELVYEVIHILFLSVFVYLF